jgi:carboxypeptidase Q
MRVSGALLWLVAVPLSAQSFPTADTVIRRIYEQGMRHSQAETLAQALTDSIGPRLTGSPANHAANAWIARSYAAWGIPARNEPYGTWRAWTRGPSSVELVAPRTRTLEATMRAWSAATPPAGVTGDVVAVPPASETRDSAGFARWLATVGGKFVLASVPLASCRPDTNWAAWATRPGPSSTGGSRWPAAAISRCSTDWPPPARPAC